MPTAFASPSVVSVLKRYMGGGDDAVRGRISRDIAVVYNVYVSKAVLTSNNGKYHSKISSLRLYVYFYISIMSIYTQ